MGLVAGRECRRVYFFPATRRALRLAEILRGNGIAIAGFLDNSPDKKGLVMDGYVILSPEVVPLCHENYDDLFVVIATYRRNTAEVFAGQLRGYGLREGCHFRFAEFESE